jgi:hypothetical protein
MTLHQADAGTTGKTDQTKALSAYPIDVLLQRQLKVRHRRRETSPSM